ncbi:MAG: hypothetical protein SGILL_008921, partial [Bacillariaceae sp.]
MDRRHTEERPPPPAVGAPPPGPHQGAPAGYPHPNDPMYWSSRFPPPYRGQQHQQHAAPVGTYDPYRQPYYGYQPGMYYGAPPSAHPASTVAVSAVAPSPAALVPTKTPIKRPPDEDPTSARNSDGITTPKTPASIASASSSTKKPPKPKKKVEHEITELEDLNLEKWYTGSVPLGVEDDKYWLSELQVYLRSSFAECFGATEEDIAAPMHGRNKPIALGQVGIRCMHCKHENPAERGQQATSYPSLISGIYNSVQQMLRLHLECCQSMPPHIRAKIEALKVSSSSRGGRKQYWVDSAKRLGLVDTRHGIHFGRDPYGPLPALTGPSVNTKEGRKKKESTKKVQPLPQPEVHEEEEEEALPPPVVDDRPLVFPEDQELISDYMYLTLEQMSPCFLMEADRVGCYKGRQVGFPGLACRHCVGQAGCGRYFPASEASLSQTTTSQTILNHVRNCRRCPLEIRENLELMKRARLGPDGRRADKPKHGGRKVFFHRLWCRIQNLPIKENISEIREKKKPGRKAKTKTEFTDLTQYANGKVGSSSEGSDSDSSDDSGAEDARLKSTYKKKAAEKKKFGEWQDGCVRLTKTDDVHWLSEVQCFARSDLVEAFAWRKNDGLTGYAGRKEPAEGQVGLRCAFCKMLPDDRKPSGCLTFPENLEAVQTKVEDMLRLHFHSCPGMPDETKDTFRTMKSRGPKKGEDPHEYWVDSAHDIGLSDLPPGNTTGWGITFRRDPLEPSPADDLDREIEGSESPPNLSKLYLIRPEDCGECTNQVFLMMRQMKVCKFEERDRRGNVSRGRDRVLDFPGLSCKHCANKNNMGRYFPVSAKNLTDNTANSMLSHMSSCSHCPDNIKASISFLSHRSAIQKAELKGSWKKTFYNKVWERLHTEKEWVDVVDDEEDDVAALDGEQEA